MGNCKDCKYWANKEEVQYDMPKNLEIGQCKKVRQFWDSTEWRDIDDVTVERVMIQPLQTTAFVQDGSDYRAYLLTLPEFGCNQFCPIVITP